MQTHITNLLAANWWKENQWRYRNKFHGSTKIYRANCGERLPHWTLITQGWKGLSAGWNHHNLFFGQERPAASTHAIGRQTRADLEAGWGGKKSLADQIRRKNGSPVAIAQSGEDAPSRFGIQGGEWVRLRWSNHWQKRRTRGWSGRAVTQWLTRKVQDLNPENQWSVGCPCWYSEHQP